MIFPLPLPIAPLPFVSNVFSSHMVLQRGRPNTFWGWSRPGTKVSVSVGRNTGAAITGADGKWSAKVMPPKVGGPYSVSIDGTEHVELTDVLVGDVWICAGQSNIEFGIGGEKGGAQEVASASDPMLRLFMAPHQCSLVPAPTNGGTWQVCTPETVVQGGWNGFSAVGYHFGHAIRREAGVPIGLMQVAWGGTNAESWIDRAGLVPVMDFADSLKALDREVADGPAVDRGEAMGWAKPVADVSDWKPTLVPDGFHELGLDYYCGTAWFRREFNLSKPQEGSATLSLGKVDDEDTTWVNGVKVGAMADGNALRNYALPPGVLHAGKNVIAVKVLNTFGSGGFTSPASELSLTLADGSKIGLEGKWLGKKSVPYSLDPNKVTTLSNGMIGPLLPLAIKGVIWYQGENNAWRAYQYRRILPALIDNWRSRFAQGDFPFYIVSLSTFQGRKSAPGDDAYAELREAQARTAQSTRNSGLALAIDVGQADGDVHPTDKKPVGERLARVALAKEYGKKIEYLGPTYVSMKVDKGMVTISLANAKGLRATGAEPGEFSIAGADRKWRWAKAKIVGEGLVVWSSEVPNPVAVRYAWQSNPTANLYNAAGLPAVPFRTDDWPGATFGAK